MKSYSNFLNEAVEGAQTAWQQWLKNNPSATAPGGKYYNDDARNKAAREFMKTFQKTGKAPGWATSGQSTQKPPTPTPEPAAQPKPKPKPAAPRPAAPTPNRAASFARGASRVANRLTGPVAAGLEYKERRDQGQSQTQAAGGALSGWGGFAAGSALSAKALAPVAALPIPGARLAYGAGVLAGGALGSMGGSKAFDAFYNRATNTRPSTTPPKPRSSSSTQGSTTNVTPPRPRTSSSTQGNTYAGGGGPNRSGTPVKPQPALTQQLRGLSIGPGGFNINGKPVRTTQTPLRPNPPKPQKSARQLELDAINADKSLSPMQKWAKANPKLAIAQKEKERIRGTVQSDNPLLKSRSGMRLGSSIVQDPKVRQLGKGYQRLANNPNTLRQKLGLKTK